MKFKYILIQPIYGDFLFKKRKIIRFSITLIKLFAF